MTPIKYTQLEEFFKTSHTNDTEQFFFLWGEGYLLEEKTEFIVSNLLLKKEREFSLTTLSGDDLTINNLIEEISTYSVFVEKKVIFAKGLSAPKEDLIRLSDFIIQGLPQNTFLILSLAKVDKRAAFFKAISKTGILIDCSISKGINKKDVNEQTQFLRNEMMQILGQNQKEIEEKTFLDILDLTGFNTDIFIENIEKLVLFIGKNRKITDNDVFQLIKRTKTDPIFDFTNAFADKNIKQCLFFLSSLLKSNFHVLQILKALTNQVRKIFAVKCFIHDLNLRKKKIWTKGLDFNSFNNVVANELKNADKELLQELQLWEESTSDFLLASKSKSNYPEYQIFKKSDNFSLTELENILIEISELDNKFKSSSQDSQVLIEDFIFRTCI